MKSGRIIGVDLGGTNVRAGIVSGETVLHLQAKSIRSQGSEEEVLEDIFSIIDVLVRERVDGIGVGAPSVIDLRTGNVLDVQNIPSWKNVPIKKILERKYKLPVLVNNDANCFAAGEKFFGRGKNYSDVVGLIIGTGLGAGIIAGGRLYSGANCGAGEFGMLPYLDQNYEYYASGQFFMNVHGTKGHVLFEKATQGDRQALGIFQEFGRHLGEAIKAICYAVDPEIIVLGGSVSKAYPFFKDSMWNSFRTIVYSLVRERLKIEVSEIENIGILGAAALFLDKS